MTTITIEPFAVAGIAVRTTNENGQAMTDIPALWARFMSENVIVRIPGRVDDTVYCIYTDYEKDHTRPYTTLLGCKVTSLDDLPAGLTGKVLGGGTYTPFNAKGDLTEGIVYHEWLRIWNAGIDRTFTTDFEVYGPKATDMKNAEVDIFIAVA